MARVAVHKRSQTDIGSWQLRKPTTAEPYRAQRTRSHVGRLPAMAPAHEGMKTAEPRNHGEPRPLEQRLLSPEQAAAYLGLRSRFAVYRLVARGQLPALRLAHKLRLDLRDLEVMIESAKAAGARLAVLGPTRPTTLRSVPRQLAPLRRRRSSVTPRVTAATRGT